MLDPKKKDGWSTLEIVIFDLKKKGGWSHLKHVIFDLKKKGGWSTFETCYITEAIMYEWETDGSTLLMSSLLGADQPIASSRCQYIEDRHKWRGHRPTYSKAEFDIQSAQLLQRLQA